jgi:hypothetical protein
MIPVQGRDASSFVLSKQSFLSEATLAPARSAGEDPYFDPGEVVYAGMIPVQGRDASSFVLSKQSFLNEATLAPARSAGEDPYFDPGEVVYAGTIPVQGRDASSFVLSKQSFLNEVEDLISLRLKTGHRTLQYLRRINELPSLW